jgi:hypothetical protein
MSYTNIILFNRTLNNTIPVVQNIAQVTGGAFPDRAWLRSHNLRVVTVVTRNPGSDREPNLETMAQIVAEMLTHMFNGL